MMHLNILCLHLHEANSVATTVNCHAARHCKTMTQINGLRSPFIFLLKSQLKEPLVDFLKVFLMCLIYTHSNTLRSKEEINVLSFACSTVEKQQIWNWSFFLGSSRKPLNQLLSLCIHCFHQLNTVFFHQSHYFLYL